MTITGLHEVTCPTCFQKADLLFRPKSQDFALLTHNTIHGFKCASTGNTYSKKLAEQLFGSKR